MICRRNIAMEKKIQTSNGRWRFWGFTAGMMVIYLFFVFKQYYTTSEGGGAISRGVDGSCTKITKNKSQ